MGTLRIIILVIILNSLFLCPSPSLGDASQNEKQEISKAQIPTDNSSLPYIQSNEQFVNLGLDITLFFGMRNGSDFFSGYQYSLILLNGNFSIINDLNFTDLQYNYLKNGTTLDTLDSYTIPTISESEVLLPTGIYTALFLINSTRRGLLNATSNFKVIASPGANLHIEFVDETGKTITDSLLRLSINETRQLYINLVNFGSSPALNISVARVGRINEPIGLFNSSIDSFIPIIPTLGTVNISFSIKPANFGIGELNIDIEYSDALGNNQAIPKTLKTHILPDIEAHIVNPEGQFDFILGSPEGIDIQAKSSYRENKPYAPLFIRVILLSDEIDFSPEGYALKEDNSATYDFSGIANKNGTAIIKLYMEFSDSDGGQPFDQLLIEYDSLSIKISAEGKIVPKRSLEDYLPYIAIFLYILLLVIILFLYWRKDIRQKFFSRILGVRFYPELKFDSDRIIIDGSNVAWENISKGGKPQIKNIILATRSLEEQGFNDITVVADAALRYQIKNKIDLDDLTKKSIVKVLPAKVDGDGFILRLSSQTGSLILTNDLFREFRDEYDWIDQRRVPYTILDDKFYIHPTFEKDLHD